MSFSAGALWALGWFALSVMTLSCGGERPVGPPAASPSPSAAEPARAIPSDLDVVVRIDLDPMRAVLPFGTEDRLAAVALGAGELRSTSEVVRHAIARARQVWVAWRPGPAPEHWDNVIVLRGDFSGLREAELTGAFQPARALGGGWRSYQARRVSGRAAPAVLYAHLEDMWVIASSAEIDAVERVLEGRASERGPEPPERGVVSLAARLPSVAAQLRRQAPKAARVLERAREGRASADLTSEGLSVSAEVQFAEEAEAVRAADALRLLLRVLALGGDSWLDGVDVSASEATVVVRAQIPHAVLSRAAALEERPAARAPVFR